MAVLKQAAHPQRCLAGNDEANDRAEPENGPASVDVTGAGSESETVATGTLGVRLLVSGDDGSELEGVVVDGECDDAGRWDLDGQFVLLTDDGERFRVNSWCCTIETGVSA